jgi:hypothetical protein
MSVTVESSAATPSADISAMKASCGCGWRAESENVLRESRKHADATGHIVVVTGKIIPGQDTKR